MDVTATVPDARRHFANARAVKTVATSGQAHSAATLESLAFTVSIDGDTVAIETHNSYQCKRLLMAISSAVSLSLWPSREGLFARGPEGRRPSPTLDHELLTNCCYSYLLGPTVALDDTNKDLEDYRIIQ
ncbi:hypothetical protein EWM64_g4904 [Hericium alpestre]|uniref:Uncharacterized protein n=1 Tax=Hericium alpestre TaxID=135208 RepID=A0A4Z0A003_9AGAM|nr:hypothetical protein EWM64_g4904 [Hericium alpestre]